MWILSIFQRPKKHDALSCVVIEENVKIYVDDGWKSLTHEQE